MAYVIAIVNQKGGVGKTTTAVNLGSGLQRVGLRTLVVDCDPQSNATRCLGVSPGSRATLYDALVAPGRVALNAIVLQPYGELGPSLVPAAPGLAGAEVELVNVAGRERRLAEVLAPVADQFDAVLLDCPPSLGLLSVNALVAADGLIVPVQCEYLSLEGLGLLDRTVRLVKSHLNPGLEVTGVVMTMYDPRTRLSAEVVNEVRRHFPTQTFATVIPRSIRLGEAPSYGETIDRYAPGSAGARAYAALAEELAERLAARGVAARAAAVPVEMMR